MRRIIEIAVTLSLAPGVTKREAMREVRTRVNEACCYNREQEEVKVRRTSARKRGEG